MNWDQILSAVFAITIGVLLCITVLFYAEHKWLKAKHAVPADMHPLQGRFFTRYVPDSLKSKYNAPTISATDDLGGRRSVFWMMIVVLTLTLITLFGWIKLH